MSDKENLNRHLDGISLDSVPHETQSLSMELWAQHYDTNYEKNFLGQEKGDIYINQHMMIY